MAKPPAKKKKKKKSDRVFTDRPRKIFRNVISAKEMWFGIIFIGFVVFMGVWFMGQKGNYDAGERDISIEVLMAQSVQDNLWEPPHEIWVEPGSHKGGVTAGPDIGIYPGSVLANGWQTRKAVKTFDWDTLYEKVDGQETQYKAFGFQFMHYLDITKAGTDLECSIELYDMVEFQNALGVFSEQRSVGSLVGGVGGAWVTRNTNGAMGIFNQFFFKFSGNIDGDAFADHATSVIEEFSTSNEGGGATPAPFTTLARDMGVGFQDIGYKKEDVFQYDFAKDFWFGGLGGESKAKYFIHQAESPEAATALYALIIEEHQWDYEVVDQTDTDTLYTHEFLKTFNSVNQSGTYVFGVEGMTTKEVAIENLDSLRRVLEAS